MFICIIIYIYIYIYTHIYIYIHIKTYWCTQAPLVASLGAGYFSSHFLSDALCRETTAYACVYAI